MSKRDYNVFFNTHTVSGIVISIGLYVVFLAGAFALFMENIDHWEVNEPRGHETMIDYDGILAEIVAQGYDMHGRDFMIGGHDAEVSVTSRPIRDSSLVASSLQLLPDSVARGAIQMEIGEQNQLQSKAPEGQKAELGNFLFDLHYFNQIPKIGIWLSGFVALFFLFAIITGLIIHWDKILSHFFTFRLNASIKNLWTNAHTTLGVIGLPYQMMYAITGTVFGMVMLVFLPFAKVMYGGNQQVMLREVFPSPAVQSYKSTGYSESMTSINSLVQATVAQLPEDVNTHLTVTVKNYADQNSHLVVNVINDQKSTFFNTVERVYNLSSGELVHEKLADDLPAYAVAMVEFLHKIHFGHYGGYFVKVIYFLLALLTCLVIISGVMIWLKSRDNKKYAHKEKFNTNVGAIYLGACLGLYPAIALLFILTKSFPVEMDDRFSTIAWVFLAFWVGYTLYAYRIKNYFIINRNSLILAGAFGILIPIFNGFHSGLWLWKSFAMGYPDSFFIDLSWLLCGILTLSIALKLKAKEEVVKAVEQSKPVDKNAKRVTLKPKAKVLS